MSDPRVAFLTVRYDEIEAVAKAAAPEDCCGYAVREWDASAVERTWAGLKPAARPDAPACVPSVENADDYCLFVALEGTAAQAEHIALHDPARVLREVEARRELLGLATDRCTKEDCYDHSPDEHVTGEVYGNLIIKALLMPYADHPDYKPGMLSSQ